MMAGVFQKKIRIVVSVDEEITENFILGKIKSVTCLQATLSKNY
jgi:hypothetical protein